MSISVNPAAQPGQPTATKPEGGLTIWISIDMEGLAGLVNWEQDHGTREMEFRRIMTGEANAAAAGAKAAGATRILVNDSHDNMFNLIQEELDPDIELISGSLKPLSMVEGIDQHVDGAFFLGYHAAAGTPLATMDHTYSNVSVSEVRINGRRVGETGLNAGVCGYYGVPVLLVAGDRAVCEEARALLGPELTTVTTKEAVSRFAARLRHPARVRAALQEAAAVAVRNRQRVPVFQFPTPVRFEVDFKDPAMADAALLVPFTQRLGGRTVAYEDNDYVRGFRAVRAMISLASHY
ncbi:MAG: M55 family metallopeptidase [Limnochordaceae bacterium]|nr:M55 family metallopeptidase [Limnochordaceae bacterium]